MFLCVVLIFSIGSVSSTDCQDGWLAFEGSCYLFDHTPVDFTEAEHFCTQRYSNLVTVDTGEENGFLKGFMSDYHGDFWLGMTDKLSEGYWRWFSNNHRVEFTDWAPSEPDSRADGGEDCAIFDDTYNQLQWADVPCGLKYRPLCEMRVSDALVG